MPLHDQHDKSSSIIGFNEQFIVVEGCGRGRCSQQRKEHS